MSLGREAEDGLARTLGKALFRLSSDCGISIEEFAHRTGVSVGVVQGALHGENPKACQRLVIAALTIFGQELQAAYDG